MGILMSVLQISGKKNLLRIALLIAALVLLAGCAGSSAEAMEELARGLEDYDRSQGY